jgi:hypothetical protein
VEFDFVRGERGEAFVSEVKFKRLSAAERRQTENRLQADWQRSALHRRFPKVAFEVLDATVLG